MVYLAHVGSFLPCTRAVIGLTDRIMTRIASFETAAAAQVPPLFSPTPLPLSSSSVLSHASPSLITHAAAA